MYRSQLTNYQVIGLCLLALGFGGILAILPFAPTAWWWVWWPFTAIGAVGLAFGRPNDGTLWKEPTQLPPTPGHWTPPKPPPKQKDDDSIHKI